MYQIPAHVVQIGQHHPALHRVLEVNQLHSWVYITSCNPYSQPVSMEENIQNMQRLLRKLQEIPDKKLLFSGWGMGYDIQYPPEYSILCVGLSLSRGKEIATEFGQNAFVYCEQQGKAQVICLQNPIDATLLEAYSCSVYTTMPIILQENHRRCMEWCHHNQIENWQIDTINSCVHAKHVQGYALLVPLEQFSS